MRMRLPSSPRALLGAALLLLPACATSGSSGRPSGTAESSSADQAPGDEATGAWKGARVGDAVTYAFTARHGGGGGRGASATERVLAGQVTLEVVAVQAPWVWLTLRFQDEAGQALSQARLAQPLVLPMRMEGTQSLEVAPLGEPRAERVPSAGQTWDALRYAKDDRPVDGNLVQRAYAVKPGPLYLTRGLLEAATESAGFRVPGGLTLSLRAFKQGGDTRAAPPSLERPLGPGTWYDRRLDLEPTPTVQRVCFGAERGYLLRTEKPIDLQSASCADLSDAEAEPLEEVLMGLAWETLVSGDWPPETLAAGTRGTLRVEDHDVPTLTLQRSVSEDGVQRVYSEAVAAEPWGPALSGLAREARFQVLSESTERVERGGARRSEGGSRLVRWGTWLDGAK